jgi:hypothetical protein
MASPQPFNAPDAHHATAASNLLPGNYLGMKNPSV